MAYDREIKFTVAGRETSDEDMLVSIPYEYHNLFDGYNFRDREQLRLALMHANCAAEAKYYRMYWRADIYERDLQHVLGVTRDAVIASIKADDARWAAKKAVSHV